MWPINSFGSLSRDVAGVRDTPASTPSEPLPAIALPISLAPTPPASTNSLPETPTPEPIPEDEATNDASSVRLPLRVYNNSLIQGLAAKAAADFYVDGSAATEIGG